MGEFDLIEKYFKRESSYPGVPLAVGDDCAIVDMPEGKQLVFSIDTLLPEVHFFADAEPRAIATRAFCVCLSDLAAMGASPVGFTMALSLPELNECWLKGFSEGLHYFAEKYRCPLIGGDTVKGPLTISIQVHGFVNKGQALKRSSAKVGDAIFVSEFVGDGAAALHALKNKEPALALDDQNYFFCRYYAPVPQISLGESLVGVANAAIDISDGFVADLRHICRASDVGAEIDLRSIPVSPKTIALSRERSLDWALHGGDDYQLCFTVPDVHKNQLQERVLEVGVSVTEVGRIVEGEGIRSCEGEELCPRGYQHF